MTRKFLVSAHAFNVYCEKCKKQVSHTKHPNGMVTVECDTEQYCDKTHGVTES